MSEGIKVVHMGRAAGKTTELLRALHEAGGGVFITSHATQAFKIAQQHKFDGITILKADPGLNVAVDDIDFLAGEVMVASNKPVHLDYIKTPQTAINPHIPDDISGLDG